MLFLPSSHSSSPCQFFSFSDGHNVLFILKVTFFLIADLQKERQRGLREHVLWYVTLIYASILKTVKLSNYKLPVCLLIWHTLNLRLVVDNEVYILSFCRCNVIYILHSYLNKQTTNH
jgi:hypothetical protein